MIIFKSFSDQISAVLIIYLFIYWCYEVCTILLCRLHVDRSMQIGLFVLYCFMYLADTLHWILASPLLFKTVWRRLGIEVMSFWSFGVGIWSHSCLIYVSSCWRVWHLQMAQWIVFIDSGFWKYSWAHLMMSMTKSCRWVMQCRLRAWRLCRLLIL